MAAFQMVTALLCHTEHIGGYFSHAVCNATLESRAFFFSLFLGLTSMFTHAAMSAYATTPSTTSVRICLEMIGLTGTSVAVGD